MKRLRISDRASLTAARQAMDCDEVTLATAGLKGRNLLPCALKYALWALRPGGRLIVLDEGVMDAGPPAYVFPFNQVRQCTFKFIAGDTDLIDLDASGRIVLERRSPILPPGWSAGVVFSGNVAELPVLHACLDSLVAQPELAPENGGEIAVCGPPNARSYLGSRPYVRWIDYEEPSGHRFLVCRKKNALISALSNPRIAVLHARIKLEADALKRVPREFDITGPNTTFVHEGRSIPYLSLSQTDTVWPGLLPRRSPLGMRQVADGDPLTMHERAGLFVDGGVFFVRRAAWEACRLNDDIAWLEGEDVEWCARAFILGLLIDMAPESRATSQTNKLSIPPNLGRWTPVVARALAHARTMRSMVKHAFKARS